MKLQRQGVNKQVGSFKKTCLKQVFGASSKKQAENMFVFDFSEILKTISPSKKYDNVCF